MAEGAVNNAYTAEEQERRDARTPPPSYPGTPSNFERKMQQQQQQDEEKKEVPPQTAPPSYVHETPITEKTGPPQTFVEVPISVVPGTVQYVDPYKGQQGTVIDSKDSQSTPTKKRKPTCADVVGLIVAIAACVMFFPLGIPAFVLSCLAINHRRNHRVQKASKYTKISLGLAITGICLFIIIVATYGAWGHHVNDDCESENNCTSGGNSFPPWKSSSSENKAGEAPGDGDASDSRDQDNTAHEVEDDDDMNV
ncbi:uncharacterized protein [Ptychodera flava]|uniref:uncharacterized protein isoform X2 n=1 Tax=Ptychodera flava TaxID=63121 RepID=UPI00396A5560